MSNIEYYLIEHRQNAGLAGYLRFGTGFGDVCLALMEEGYTFHTADFPDGRRFALECSPPLRDGDKNILQTANYRLSTITAKEFEHYRKGQESMPRLLGIDGGC